MSGLKKVALIFILFLIMGNCVFATSQVNMNLASSTNNTVSNSNTSNTTSTNSNTASSSTKNSVNTAAVVKSVNETDTTTAGLSMSEIINILLIAVGFILILLAVAILIRLKNQ